MRISMFELSAQKTILSGSFVGRKLLADIISATKPTTEPEIVYLDFDGIEVATSSFLRECVFGFRDFARSSSQNIYPVIANASPMVIEEIEFFTAQRGDILWHCRLDDAGHATSSALVGELEPALRSTFDIVRRLGSASAPQLAAQADDEKIGATAWNNRLSALSSKGLLIERRNGKTKSFNPLMEID